MDAFIPMDTPDNLVQMDTPVQRNAHTPALPMDAFLPMDASDTLVLMNTPVPKDTPVPFVPKDTPIMMGTPVPKGAPIMMDTPVPMDTPIVMDTTGVMDKPISADEQEETRSPLWLARMWIYPKVVTITLALVICLRLFVFDVVQVSGVSMEPTLFTTDRLIINKTAFVFNTPQRYDIIMLDIPDSSTRLIKRIVGLPTEHIAIVDGLVYINGELLNEEYLNNIKTDGDLSAVIPDGYYFVMGDNRPASRDSRVENVGPIPQNNIGGKAILRFYPLDSFKIL
jgi:signal peptidase I